MSSSPFRRRVNDQGVALVIVLAFVVLLTGLIVAFFSQAVIDRQISNSSANATKADLFAQGAVDTITGDLKQEITAGSVPAYPSPSPAAGTVYTPSAPQTAVVSLAGTAAAAGTENLLKRSAYSVPFYPSAAPYSAANYPPSNRAANVSSTTNSQNGRYVSLARWNKALLLQKQNTAATNDSVLTPVTAFTAPDWVLMSRNGTNPGASSPATPATFGSGGINDPTTSNPTYVVGRYSYAIYNEGGLLDMNAAGYPSNSTPAQIAYKGGLAFADLTQLQNPNGNSLISQTQIDQIVGWRNYASAATNFSASPTPTPAASLANTFPSYVWSSTNANNYYLSVLSNPTGFLQAANPLVIGGPPGQTDKLFSSRQELLQLLLTIPSVSGSAATATDQANWQLAAPYLGTFSRSLNQPSYVPVPAAAAGAPPDANHRPATLAISAGGNGSVGGDNSINPSGTSYPAGFLSIRVLKAFTRSDNSLAVVGEPLVKRRFDLNRLAWLTYVGPITLDGATYNPQLATNYVSTLKSTYGFTDAFLLQGTKANIQKYFGMNWQVDSSRSTGTGDGASKWFYNVNLWGTGGTGTTGPIMTLPQIAGLTTATQQHEPDFFELIKSAVCTGSIGKAYAYTASAPIPVTPAYYQQERDNSTDAQIIQIGANIIDQFDLDGYSTHIIFNNGLFGTAQEYRGIEDLPYIYRVREGKITVRDSNPSQSNLPTVASATPTDAGLLAILQEPEIWNPHGWIATNPDSNARPTSFRIVAISADPNTPSANATNVTVGTQCLVYSGSSFGGAVPSTNLPSSPGPVWNEASTEIDFSILQHKLYLFREPTLLVKPGVPDVSVQIGAGNLISSVFKAASIPAQWPATQIAGNNVGDTKQYIGFLAGSGPVAWSATVPEQGIDATTPATAMPGIVEATSAYTPTTISGITYRLQYKDPSGVWSTYDEKYTDYLRANSYNNGSFWTNDNKTFNSYNGTTADNIIGTEIGEMCFDPRTSRFGMNYVGTSGYRGSGFSQFPLRQNVPKIGWAAGSSVTGPSFTGAITQLALATQRPDNDAGFSFSGGNYTATSGPTAPGWFPSSTANTVIQPGMFTQNNPAEAATPTNLAQVTLDGQTVGGTLNQYYADADGVIRRAMGGYVPTDSMAPADLAGTSGPSGLAMKTADDYSGPTPAPNGEISSRPVMLNRPFRSAADLSVVFSGTPWKNLDVSTPESGATPLLDVFSVGETNDPNGMIAGKVDLNTRQTALLEALISGAFADELNPANSTVAPPLSSTDATSISAALASHTNSAAAGDGPLTSLCDLVGRWNSPTTVGASYSGSSSYAGFSGAELTTALNAEPAEQRISRFRESAIRALAGSGQTRVWNLMIDLVAQTGRYPASAATLSNFIVEGEQRYWVHLAIDRFTGQVIDKQIEVVKE
jgi:Tfp pilus assembly protein PilX